MVLSFILIQNRQGKTRLAKWYAPYDDAEKVYTFHAPPYRQPYASLLLNKQHNLTPLNVIVQVRLKGEVHRLIAPRDQKYQSNFVEFRSAPSVYSSNPASGSQLVARQNLSSTKIVYRRYAGLFFCVCVDANDNELAYLEAIHFFVEVLDQFFGNVCELDLVFNFYKVYAILDEVFLAGEIEETSKQVVLTRLEHLDKLD